ncbi:hypothetical protein FIBSPDRAFT_481958 [Athelia psychrophila]|uniref:F-box domain-containing protein n=1 Tax=Athelia psychrophila TaxID=1759441 RepID=A0A166VH11_9AGAM|nr:hypothetical protein FIBSPDRAFT_481958 [Fibularhizoctonia sp. CBS 109695]
MGNSLATEIRENQTESDIGGAAIRLQARLKAFCALLLKTKPSFSPTVSRTAALPTEIIAFILRLAQSECDDTLTPAMRAVTLSHVSRRWRQIAINTTRLWCDIHLSPSTSTVFLETQISRSQASVLALYICEISSGMDHASRIPHPHVTLVLSQLARIRSLIISTQTLHTVVDVFRVLQHSYAPVISKMVVDLQPPIIPSHNGDAIPSAMAIFSHGAPRLSSLSFHGISTTSCSPPMTAMIHLHLGSIEGLSFVALTCDELRATLLACSPTLRSLSFSGMVVHFTHDDCMSRIDMPSLQSLTIHSDQSDTGPSSLDTYFDSLFTIISSPMLRSLELGTSSLQEHHLQNFLMTMQSSSRVTSTYLRFLKISHTARSYNIGRNVMELFPSITHLEMNTSDADILFTILHNDSLLPTAERDNLWPELHSITLPVLDSQNLNLGRLRKFILGRVAIGRPIHDLCLVSYDKYDIIPRTHLEWLRQHVILTLRCDELSEHVLN